jgi:hypothetical protein
MPPTLFLPGFRDQPWKVSFCETEFAGAGLTERSQTPPSPVFQALLQRLTDEFVRRTMVLVGRRLWLRQQ